MKLTKYKHSCFTLEKDGKVLVVDPGVYSTDFIVPKNVVAIFVTHQHNDHFSPDMIRLIVAKNPDAKIVAHESVTTLIEDLPTLKITTSESIDVGPFTLKCFGDVHAEIHPDIERVPNLGVLINNIVYYGGDAFARPDISPKLLLAPIGANWMRIRDTIELLYDLKPSIVVPTHDAPLSDIGKKNSDHWLQIYAEKYDISFIRPKESIHIDE